MLPSNQPPLVSIVIVNYNGEEVLETCLRSVFDSDYPNFEVIFVDNASTDGSVKLVKEKFGSDSRLIIILNNKNLGLSEGNNIGIMHAKGEFIVILNNDTEVDRNWLRELIRVMELDPTIGAAQCKLLRMDDRKRIDSAGVIMDAHGCAMGRGRIHSLLEIGKASSEIDKGQWDRIEEIFAALGNSSIFRRTVLYEVGLFDPKFFVGYEDVDISWRIRLRNYKIVFAPNAIVYHKGTATISGKGLRWIVKWHFSKNRIAMLIKNYSFRNLVKVMLIIIPVYFLLILFSFNTRASIAYFKGLAWNVKELNYLVQQRKIVQKSRRVSDDEISRLFSKKCISIQYILKPYLKVVQNRVRHNLVQLLKFLRIKY